jgi:hypothetical protein
MTISLPLAIDIVEVAEARGRRDPPDLEAEAERLLKAHPEAEASRKQVVELLREEQEAAECALL